MNIVYREDDRYFYAYLEEHPQDCCCMWSKSDFDNRVYSIDRLDVLPELRRQGIGRSLLAAAIRQIKSKCPQACIEILAQPDEDGEISKEALAALYESVNFKVYRKSFARIELRLYLDESLMPTPLYDNPEYFKLTI